MPPSTHVERWHPGTLRDFAIVVIRDVADHCSAHRAERVGTPPLKTCFEGGMWWRALVFRPVGAGRHDMPPSTYVERVAFRLACDSTVVVIRGVVDHFSLARKGWVATPCHLRLTSRGWRSGTLRDFAIVVIRDVADHCRAPRAERVKNAGPPNLAVKTLSQ